MDDGTRPYTALGVRPAGETASSSCSPTKKASRLLDACCLLDCVRPGCCSSKEGCNFLFCVRGSDVQLMVERLLRPTQRAHQQCGKTQAPAGNRYGDTHLSDETFAVGGSRIESWTVRLEPAVLAPNVKALAMARCKRLAISVSHQTALTNTLHWTERSLTCCCGKQAALRKRPSHVAIACIKCELQPAGSRPQPSNSKHQAASCKRTRDPIEDDVESETSRGDQYQILIRILIRGFML